MAKAKTTKKARTRAKKNEKPKVEDTKAKVEEPKAVAQSLTKGELKLFNGKIPEKAHPQIIHRPSYLIILVRGDDEKTISELMNTGRVVGASHVDTDSADDGDNEIVYVLKK